MKERYDSEKGLKNAFDNYQMPFDNDAFDKFKGALDKEEKRKKFIWWIFYGKMIVPVLIIGIAILAYLYISDPVTTQKLSSATTINTPESIEKGKEEKDHLSTKYDDGNTAENGTLNIEKEKNINIVNEEQKIKSNDNANDSVKKNATQITSSTSNNKEVTNYNYVSPINDDINSGTLSLGQNESSSSIVVNDNSSIPIFENQEKSKDDNPEIEIIRTLEDLAIINTLMQSNLERLKEEKLLSFSGEIIPFKEKYGKHFYLNWGIGISKDDNFGVNDQFFEVLQPNEFLWHASVAYQLNDNTSFELGLMRKNLSLGYTLRDFTYWIKTGNKVSIIRANMVNKIWSFGPNIRLNMSNGIAMIKASDEFNTALDFSKTVSGMDDPVYINNINLEWQGLYSKNHFMYSGGLNLDCRLSKNVDLNIGAEYALGFKPVMKADLKYIEGEGVVKNVETKANGSFASVSLGLKYRLRRQ